MEDTILKKLLKKLKSTKLEDKKKHELINKRYSCKRIQRIQRDYSLVCAARSVEHCSDEKIKEFFTLCIFINQNELFDLKDTDEWRAYRSAEWDYYWSTYRSAYQSANWSAYWSAYWSADLSAVRSADLSAVRSADRSAERKIQIDVFIDLLECEI